MNKHIKRAAGITFNACSIVFGLSLLFSTLSQNKQVEDVLSDFFNSKGSVETITTGKEPIRFKTWYSSVQDVLNGNDDVAKAAQAEGTVLLQNKNNALPLNKEADKVSLFGVTAYDPMYSLDGAGEVKVNKERQEFFKEELENKGVKVNEDLATWYKDNTQYHRVDYINIYDNNTNKNGVNAKINGAAWENLPESKTKDGFNTGIFVTGRMTNEGVDITPTHTGSHGAKDNNYLKLTDNELSVLQGMKEAKEQGKITKSILIINQANPVVEDLPEVLKTYNVDAALWIGYPGSAGLSAVADILVGDTSPSGGLSTTWFTSREAHPTTPYFGLGGDVLMQEDIYAGYRYAETRYEDYVLGTEGAGEYIYGDNIAYPFGYGESYADFSYEVLDLIKDEKPEKNFNNKGELKPIENRRKDGDDYILKVKVTNNSTTTSAKEIVQVYLQKPYSDTDKANKVQNASVELVGFEKTKKLAPGASDTVEVKIDANKLFASYDGVKKTYTVEEGKYLLSAARNSHEAINNILLKKAGDGVSLDKNKMDADYGEGKATNVKTVEVSKEYSDNYKYYTHGGAEVKNLFDSVDPNIASGNPNKVKYMNRSNWVDSADNAKSQVITLEGTMNDARALHGGAGFNYENASKNFPEVLERFGNEYPNYGLHRTDDIAEIQLSEMIGVEYDDAQGATEESKAKWEYFLDQLTWEESAKLAGTGLRRTVAVDSIGKPYTNDVNASNAISWRFDMSLAGGSGSSNVGFANRFDPSDRDHNPTGYPCEGIIAATFNKELAFAVGQAIGEDGLWTGAVGLYGFGLGLHRNPYHGRAGEYYSDDPYLSGIMGGYESKGAQSKGMYVYNKHFILNDQEENRTGYRTWLNEQTFREVYIRPFELAIEIGDAMNVMNSFNNVGSGWSGNNYNLMTACLRDELGMRGFAVTDYFPAGGMNLKYGILAGTDLPDGNSGAGQILPYGPESGTNLGFYAQAVRQSCRRILYTVANSAAMNFIGDDTKIIVHEAPWLKTKDVVLTTIYSVYGVVAGLFVITYALDFILKFKKN